MIFTNDASGSTVVHKLHPFSKMAVGAVFTLLALCLKNPAAIALLLGFLIPLLFAAKLSLTPRRWLSILLFLTVVSALNFAASQDKAHAATYSLRFAVFLTAMPILAAATDPQQMTRALSRTPLPPGVVMALLLVWRFFPMMAEEARQIRQAALLRGNFAGSPFSRIYRGFVVPMAFCVLEYADRITLTLELRGFSVSESRTCRKPPRADFKDACFGMLAAAFAGSAAWLQWGV